MFSSRILQWGRKLMSCSVRKYQVTVTGGASELGQTICLLLRELPSVTRLVVHDADNQVLGVSLDLYHIPTQAALHSYSGEDSLDAALQDADLVIATGGNLLQPGLSAQTWLDANTQFIKTLSSKLAKIYPMPFVGIVTEPINSFVPMVAELMRYHGNFHPNKLFGISTVDAISAQTIYAAKKGVDATTCSVPIVGGHSDETVVPLLSQATPPHVLSESEIQLLTKSIRSNTKKIVDAKSGWSPTLSVAYGVLTFTKAILKALEGNKVKVHAYIENNDFGTSYFSGLVNVDVNGANEMERYEHLTNYECQLLENSLKALRKDIMNGKKILESA